MQIDSHKNENSSYSDQFLPHYIDAYKAIIAGGRDFGNYEYMCEKLNDLFYNSTNFEKRDIKIISGMAKGADTLAIRYADERKLTKILFNKYTFCYSKYIPYFCTRIEGEARNYTSTDGIMKQ